MSVESFIDTNIFVYQLERIDTRKAEIAERLIEQGIATGSACISFQVVQECLNVVLRKAQIVLGENEMRKYLQSVLAPLFRVQPSMRLYHAALDIQSRYQFNFYDSLIIAAALEAGCKTLYSEDLQHGQQIEQLTIQNPFVECSTH
jgi:predicted nucleic acid-binding protein